jgi:hypothetical protein
MSKNKEVGKMVSKISKIDQILSNIRNCTLGSNSTYQINMSKFDKRLPKIRQTKFGDQPSIILVGDDIQRFFYFNL